MSEYDSMPREMGWDDEITDSGNPYEVLPEGDYRFHVDKFERARHPGSDKLPPCNKAILTLSVTNSQAGGTVQTQLFLHSKSEWKLCQFFIAIGQMEKKGTQHMNWQQVPGASGHCHIKVRKWTGNDGKEREGNEVTEFYEPEKEPPVFAAPAAGAPGGWVPGQF